ncbi:MAG: hypothetical protein K2H70_03785, partial [Bacteroidales bacterium]|nr:hypothetical protein [Bacteroidales bacterium]
ADRTYTLQATPKRAGDNPTYAWFINGVAVSGATAATFTFDPTALPAGVSKAADGIYRVRVMATRDEALTQETDPYQFVNPVACATATLTVYDLPAIDVTADATNLTVIDSTTVRVSGVEEGGTVSWTPADYLYTPDQPESETKPIAESGSHWFTATVTSTRGCVASDSVEIVVASSFTYDSTHVLVLVPPALPWLSDGEGGGDVDKPWTLPDTNVNIVVVGDPLQIKTCRNSLVFLTLFTSGGEPTLVYEWDENGLQPLTDAELADMGYAPLPDTMAAFYLDGTQFEFGCTVTERDGVGLSVHVQGYISYYVTEHVALEALPHMRHNRYYENQVVYFTAHPNNFEQYHFYRYDVTADGQTGEQHGDSRHYKTSYDREDGAEQAVYVAVADRYGGRSYDSVNLRVISLPNAMIFNDPNYPEADVIFPEFEVEVHDSWGRMVKSMVDGLGWDGTYAGKQVEGG